MSKEIKLSKEDQILLITDLSMRLPHGVWLDLGGIKGKMNNLQVTHYYENSNTPTNLRAWTDFFTPGEGIEIIHFKPLLRSLKDMTTQEEIEFNEIRSEDMSELESIQYLLSRHFDINGLHKKNLCKLVTYDFYFD